MAIKKDVVMDNGLILNYHRIAEYRVTVNGAVYFNLHSYISESSRKWDKQREEEIKIPPYGSEILPQYYYEKEYMTKYDGDVSTASLYNYLKTLDVFNDAKDC